MNLIQSKDCKILGKTIEWKVETRDIHVIFCGFHNTHSLNETKEGYFITLGNAQKSYSASEMKQANKMSECLDWRNSNLIYLVRTE